MTFIIVLDFVQWHSRPNKLMKTELANIPTTVVNTPTKTNTNDKADIYTFKTHIVAAGQRKAKKSGTLIRVARQPTIAVRI